MKNAFRTAMRILEKFWWTLNLLFLVLLGVQWQLVKNPMQEYRIFGAVPYTLNVVFFYDVFSADCILVRKNWKKFSLALLAIGFCFAIWTAEEF